MFTKKIKIFSLQINDIDLQKYISIIEKGIEDKKKLSICYTNAHVANLSNKDPFLLNALNRFDINYADGFGLSVASKFLNGIRIKRFTLTEHAFEVLKVCEEKSWKIFLLGGEQKFTKLAVLELKKMYPRLILSGFLNGFNQLNENTIEIINDSKPDILWVGLGTPKQEFWVQENIERLNCKIINCVGDLFTVLAGQRLRGPKVLSDNGFEWLFRLIQHPIKYFNRYVIGIPYFVFLVFRYKLLKHKK